jgi:uncharacterized protein (DUF302 family)
MKRETADSAMDFSAHGAFVRGESTLAVVSTGTFDEVAAKLEGALASSSLEIVHVHDLDQLLRGKGPCGEFRCRIYEVWNAAVAVELLELDADLAHVLPYRITLHDQGGVTTVVTPSPRVLMSEFSHATEVGRLSRRLEGLLQPLLHGLC